ncbi:protein kinase [Microvenator marinus]|uniref:Protein kinase n=1 Tax=Microvenator marinus TaxID=2600177 RepID=A0A5B8XVY3_9DELT|nr:serine/threonine-protein kinase [Microvenator marinus]QED28263.1 protein kinase [Microvenator marinus]
MSIKTKEKVGPYRILRRLGEGGMGVVDLGEDPITGQRVAIKHVTVDAGPILDGLRREVRLIAEIDHAHVVRILEHELWDENPWYAMEFVGSESLRHRLTRGPGKALTESDPTRIFGHLSTNNSDELDTEMIVEELPTLLVPETEIVELPSTNVPPPEVWSQRLKAVTDICSALSELHAHGIVHRDLKPENILFRPTGEAVLVDFGISMLSSGSLGREKLTRSLRASGTPAYLSPEQAMSRPVDARSDLYSLGCIMFEMVTGRVPFDDPIVLKVLQHHAFSAPPSARALNPSVPAALDELITQLLQKSPQDRLGYAIDVDDRLRKILKLPAPNYPAPHYIYTPAFVGRDDEYNELLERIQRFVDGHPLGIKITGEGGIGKTRLVHEVVQALGQSVHFHFGNGDKNGQISFGALIPIWRTLMSENPNRALAIMHRQVEWWDSVVDGTRVVGWEDLQRVRGNFAEVIDRGSPQIFVLDDAHELDPWSATLVESLITDPIAGLGIILLVRDTETIRAPIACDDEIHLERLSRANIKEIIASMTGVSTIDDIYVDFAMSQCDGNPFFLAEIARVAMQENVLRRDAAGRWHVASDRLLTFGDNLTTSNRVEALLESQLAPLSAELLDALQWCACIGSVFEPSLLRDLLETFDPIQELLEKSILTWHDTRLRFRHLKLADATYKTLSDEEKERKHRAIGELLEARSKRTDTSPFALAHHLEMGGLKERAAPYHYLACMQAIRSGSNIESYNHFCRWIICTEATDEEFWNKVLDYLGQHFSDRSHFFERISDDLTAKAEAYGDPSILAKVLSYATRHEDDLEKQTKLLVLAYAAALESQDPRAHAFVLRAERAVANTARDMAHWENAVLQLIDFAKAHGLVEDHAEALIELSLYRSEQGKFREARSLLDDLDDETLRRSPRSYREYLSAFAVLAGDIGNTKEAIEAFEKLVAELRRDGDNRALCTTLWNLANQYHRADRNQEAHDNLREVETITGFSPFFDIRAYCAMLQARVEFMLGNLQRADNYYLRAEQAFDHPALGPNRYRSFLNLQRAEFFRRTGKLDEAVERLPELTQTDPYLDAMVWVERGFLNLARGQSANRELKSSRVIIDAHGFGPDSEPGRRIQALQRASQSGARELWFGERADELPKSLTSRVL